MDTAVPSLRGAESRKGSMQPAASTTGTNESEEFESFDSDFDFSARFSEVDGQPWSPAPMSTAEELFCNGQIRPLQSSSLGEQFGLTKPPEIKSDDGYFDFRSSADYTLSVMPQSPRVSSPKQDQKKQRFGLSKPTIQATASALEQWKKASKDARRRSLDGRIRHEATTAGQSKLAAIETPARRAKEGGHRRARSLSPLRVFHMDDQPRQSFESASYSAEIKGACKDANNKPMRSKRWRLHAVDSRVHQSTTSKCEKSGERVGKSGSTKAAGVMSSTAIMVPSSRSSRSTLAVSPHELHYTSQRAQAEQMRRRTFLPYRHGLLGCLGFTSKSYRSVAGIHALNAES